MYTELERRNVPSSFSDTAEIFSYCKDGFRSYTFHYKNARSVMKPDDENRVSYFAEIDDDYFLDTIQREHMEDVEKRGQIRLAMLDESGNILKVSPKLWVNTKDVFEFNLGDFYYNGATDTWKSDTHVSALGVTLYTIVSMIGVALTCFVEWVVSCAFRLSKDYGKLVLTTNFVSQVVMRIGFVLLYGVVFWKYSQIVFLLEIAVYLGEYIWYRISMREITQKKILLYTIIANTASLILGLKLNMELLYFG